MKQNNPIRDAIDESLSGVRFDAQDMRSVLRAARNRGQAPARKPAPRRAQRPQFAFAMAMLLILVLPIGLLALRAQSMRTTHITAEPDTASPISTLDPHADLIVSTDAPRYTADESEAIRIARACFEEVCDTSIFTFEEYAVSVSPGKDGVYCVTMESIYGNGCRFTAQVSMTDRAVLAHSTPRLATVPTYLDSSAPEVRAWYDKNGPFLFTWPQHAQAEFSRRYEGGALRAARPGELTAEEAAALAEDRVRIHLPVMEGITLYCYPMLYAERASTDGVARYVVTVYPSSVSSVLPEPLATVSFHADGSDLTMTTK